MPPCASPTSTLTRTHWSKGVEEAFAVALSASQ
jgi:hypothetical protein